MIKKVLCLGFFDCVHLGHRKLLSTASDIAKKAGEMLEVVTFDDNFFTARNCGKRLIYTAYERTQLLLGMGIDSVNVIQATNTLFDMSGNAFLDKILTENVSHVVVGKDYTYGKNAEGNTKTLVEYCNKKSISINVVDLYEVGLNKVASSSIRQLIKNGDIVGANALLGDDYFMSGEVVHGKGNGRKFNIPTANLAYLGHKLLPKQGVYKTKALVDGKVYHSLTNVGTQPTFEGSAVTVETLILDFDKDDIYEKNITVKFVRMMRGIQKFNSPNELVEQITKDIAEAQIDD